LALAVVSAVELVAFQTSSTPAAKPIAVVETSKGTFEIQFWPATAPKGVEHLVALIKQGFYRGLRVHRVTPSLMQFGDPLTRDMRQEPSWGSGGSGKIIGAVEIAPSLHHVRGTVGLAHAGEAKADAKFGDSQLYIMKTASPSLDGKYSIVGQVTSGMAVVDKIEKTDLLKNVTIKGPSAP
jgi:cyclophilin family peptidyl-prolyl cis-trans isomerase